jgi:hypothetical protein
MPVGEFGAIYFKCVESYGVHIAQARPRFILELIDSFPGATDDAFFYFDADLVVKAPWGFFADWVSAGIAAVCDVYMGKLPALHPIRRAWHRTCLETGFSVRELDSYYLSGIIGVPRGQREFVKNWLTILNHVQKTDKSILNQVKAENFGRTYPYYCVDQDTMNAALMTGDFAIAEIGSEAISEYGYLCDHAWNADKPWQHNYLSQALRGQRPGLVDTTYWQNAASPIRLFSDKTISAAQKSCVVARAIGRFYSRG